MSGFFSLGELTARARAQPADVLAADEEFWARFAQGYERDERFIQLNYGYYHPALKAVLEVEIATTRELNRRGSHFKRFDSDPLREAARADLARVAGVTPREIAMTRNTSESLNIVIQGFSLAPGDEVIVSDQDYGGMDEAWAQRVKQDGVILRRVNLPLHPRDDEEIVQLFERALSPRTRLMHVTHLIHLSGRLLPAAKLCALARRHQLPVLVDAAHSFAQIEFSVNDLDCDFLGASLHKWLGAPLRTGLLYVRQSRIPHLRPLFGDTFHATDDIRRFEQFGNRPDSANAGLREAIRWHDALGTKLKQARLSLLHRRWADPLRKLPRFQIHTPHASSRHGAIGLLSLDGVSADQLCDYLMNEHRIFTAVQKLPSASGVRVTPGLATPADHLDRLLAALGTALTHFR